MNSPLKALFFFVSICDSLLDLAQFRLLLCNVPSGCSKFLLLLVVLFSQILHLLLKFFLLPLCHFNLSTLFSDLLFHQQDLSLCICQILLQSLNFLQTALRYPLEHLCVLFEKVAILLELFLLANELVQLEFLLFRHPCTLLYPAHKILNFSLSLADGFFCLLLFPSGLFHQLLLCINFLPQSCDLLLIFCSSFQCCLNILRAGANLGV
mmetsp:Transcript_24473/g.58018  ORF Transcript_24473/g.58018 Transcript_24473/m.58018 type:complete len:209 (+) Transcript_24473:1823-2449(+)